MTGETILVLHAFRMGMLITFGYDCLRVWRRVVVHNGFWVSLEDLVFWCICACEVFLMMYRVSDGLLRWYAVVGALAGMLLYLRTLSRPFVKYVSKLLRSVAAFLGKILHVVMAPMRKIGGRITAAAGKVQKGRNAGRKYLKNRLTQLGKTFKIMRKQ